MGAACARPEPPSPAEAAVPGADKAFGPLGGAHAFEIELEGGWVPLEPRVSAMIAEGEARGQQRVEYHARRQNYVVDLQVMEQINKLSGTRRRIRRAGGAPASGRLRPCSSAAEAGAAPDPRGSAEALRAPPAPGAFPELLQLGEPELGRLRGSRAALDAFLLALPQARALAERGRGAREEAARLRGAAAADLASASHRADAAAEALLQQSLEAGPMGPAELAGFKERFLQRKAEKHRGLIAKRRLECSDAEWHALCLAPVAARGGL